MKSSLPSEEATETVVRPNFLCRTEAEAEPRRQLFRIGDLAVEFGVTLRALRFYEERGILGPERRGTTRIYSRRDRVRLGLVLLAKTLGFSLLEARQMIEQYDQPDGARIQMETALRRFEEQQAILLRQRDEIDVSIEALDTSIALVRTKLLRTDCPS